MTDAVNSVGTRLLRGDGEASETFTVVGEVLDISGPDGTTAEIDVSNFDSTAKEYVLDLSDNGNFSGSMNFLGKDAMQQGIQADKDNSASRNFELYLKNSDGSEVKAKFRALVTQFSISAGVGSALTAAFTLRITGSVDWTY